MKSLIKNKKILAGVAGALVLVVAIVLLVAHKKPQIRQAEQKITVKRGSQSVDVYNGGKMVFDDGQEMFEQRWIGTNGETPYSFFLSKIASGDYSLTLVPGCIEVQFSQNGQSMTVCFAETPETKAIFDAFDEIDGSGGSGSGGSGDGGIFDDFFPDSTPGTRTPKSYSTPLPGQTVRPTNRPVATPDDCPYWRLSYCVYPTTPKPVATPSPTPQSNVLPPDCAQNQLTGKTVISNELCLTTPSPSPQQ